MKKLEGLLALAYCLTIFAGTAYGAMELYTIIEQQALFVIPSPFPR